MPASIHSKEHFLPEKKRGMQILSELSQFTERVILRKSMAHISSGLKTEGKTDPVISRNRLKAEILNFLKKKKRN